MRDLPVTREVPRWLIIVGLIVVLAIVGGIYSGVTDGGGAPTATTRAASNYQAEFGGSAAVYERISTTTDCAVLQAEFDTAAASNDAATAGTDESRWTLGYMTAADDRLEQLGCYD